MSAVATQTEASCRHCGTEYPLPAHSEADTGFCCAGCQFVFGLINSEGLDQFYDLRGGQTLQPVKSLAFQQRDYDWLAEQAREAETVCAQCEDPAKLTLDLQGISCAACVWLIERIFRRHPGGLRIVVDAQLGQMRIWWEPGKFDALAFAQELQHFGYAVGPASEDAALRAARSESRNLMTRVGVVGGLALNTMAFTVPRYLGMEETFFLARLFELISLASASLALLVGGGYFFRRAWRALTIGALHMDLPISIGLIAAYLGSLIGWMGRIESLMYFDFVATFAFLMLGGRWLQQAAVERNRAALLSDTDRRREVLRIGAGETEEIVSASDLAVGDRFRVKPGETLPVAAILDGDVGAEFSLEWINGEPEPRAVSPGAEIPAGAVNVGRGAIEVTAREAFADSLLTRLLEVSERAGHGGDEGAETGRDFGRVLRAYLVAVLVIAFLGGAGWLSLGGEWPKALQVLISVLVVSCPCALGVALPLMDDLIVARLRRSGLFIQSGGLWARLKQVRQIVFDKTGTLTREAPRLINPEVITALDPEARGVLFDLVQDSRHPVGRAIREALIGGRSGRGERTESPEGIEETVAQGVGWIDPASGVEWSFGKPGWKADSPDSQASTVFSRDGKCLAAFQFEEALRDDAVAEVTALQARGYRLAVLSGDASERVQRIAAELGLSPDLAISGASPQDKADWLLAHDPEQTLYVGDGANDSLAFEAAACRGTPAIGSGVLERQSDFYFLGQGLHAIRRLLDTARTRRLTAARILTAAIAYNVAVVAVALAGLMNPLLAAVLMPLSSVATLAIAATAGRK